MMLCFRLHKSVLYCHVLGVETWSKHVLWLFTFSSALFGLLGAFRVPIGLQGLSRACRVALTKIESWGQESGVQEVVLKWCQLILERRFRISGFVHHAEFAPNSILQRPRLAQIGLWVSMVWQCLLERAEDNECIPRPLHAAALPSVAARRPSAFL